MDEVFCRILIANWRLPIADFCKIGNRQLEIYFNV